MSRVGFELEASVPLRVTVVFQHGSVTVCQERRQPRTSLSSGVQRFTGISLARESISISSRSPCPQLGSDAVCDSCPNPLNARLVFLVQSPACPESPDSINCKGSTMSHLIRINDQVWPEGLTMKSKTLLSPRSPKGLEAGPKPPPPGAHRDPQPSLTPAASRGGGAPATPRNADR